MHILNSGLAFNASLQLTMKNMQNKWNVKAMISMTLPTRLWIFDVLNLGVSMKILNLK